MPVEHLLFIEQTTDWKTFDTPDKAIPVDSFSLDPGVEYVERRVTGGDRSLRYAWLGQKLVTGSIEMMAWFEYLGWFIKAAGLHDVADTVQGATSAVLHGFFPDHTSLPLGLSVQAKRDASNADNLVGVLLTSLTISCQAGEPVMLSSDFIAYDEAPTGGTWDFDGSSAPAVIASPAYFADTILPFRFQHGLLNVGGTLTFDDTENKYTLAGGSSAVIESIELTIENNYDPRVFIGNRVPGNVVGQDFNISGRFDLDQSSVDGTFRDYYRSGANNAIWFACDSGVEADTGFNYDLKVVVPNVHYPAGGLPDLSGSQDRRMQSVEFTGKLDDNDQDINIQIIDTEASY